MVLYYPYFTLTDTRSTTLLCWRGSRTRNWKICCVGMAGILTSLRDPSTTACTRRWPQHLSVAWRISGLIRKSAGRAALRPDHAGLWWCCVRQRVGVHRWRWTDIGLKASGVRIRFRWQTLRPIRSVCGFLRTGCARLGQKSSSTNPGGSDRNSPKLRHQAPGV